ncbi:dna-directed rna polymerase subunit beta : DNA-directed RNA polymerase subunit beta' OS=Singulisphaera acidiphila (strain ATCC BAA-1392 / DSM 18658 / VKM B-2454 / MOB10) GN=rpoC PE=3 SV=1: RNA_pol_Rpb1_1: RNA_pol_Rpb1_2: RNA_pol_Rpb1_3: RNA_pol_Rpb1_4: RNA_pol_Rpb1_5 [Gemmata massiliana]|uniref:DNA-directed RNA polymerase subunit beta' n=1 Tax=Gemmata massiliana TaxID=1210884 RepID=A0A6P2D655_9BACT|nr:DNA-directed RNA polymerase subunit beta' [Gemmata massiliana]VTR96629.1 dna-directed rna polymerase subunit beta : DNA-directed RNA polymerase subunit beta' OS=Singulisphaera acidiphila (strain ATCC BAA-1392 / DSM 18658 / VKM B-2454 / MOB10) GN=rpoC PE=3 SV=1: RNA_pol_Rpb1_1: RNA_pol_Rpb1_2: RNA_pol_Rpb1_3: RNA_pol_Rpb1_4: RNA_pol_Rpb1_5 [Gemmata massiliana]
MSTAANNNKNADASEGTSYERINDFGAVRISLASPQDIHSWSHGEVKKPETINYRTYRPEKDGLFCEKIFGPEKDWECSCGKYRGMKYKGMICDRCGVKVTHSRVRRKRMGHIQLAAHVVHIWFFKAMPSRLGTLLDMKTTNLEKIIYFQDYVVINPGDTEVTKLKERELLNEEQYKEKRGEHGDMFEVDMGAEAIKKLLERLDLVKLSVDLRERLDKEVARGEKKSKQREKELVKRLKTVEALRDSSNKCEWMVLECIPVIPPDLRPLVLLDSGNFATSDLNDLYRRIINRNNRLKKLVDLNAPEVIIRNEKRMLQQSVDALFDNNRCKRPVLGSSNRPLKSLTDMIKGKQGRFRENLLGKRVDYSARSVIVVGPELKLHQCGLPKKIALELFQPFIIRRLKELNHADTIKSAKKMLERKDDVVWDILEEVTRSHPVMLNRAPTLHRMGIQAFEPVLIEGNAIRIHPLVCKGFNADFDGDQMAVHLPLSIEAQVEATVLMMSTNNIFSPANGNPIITPSQDIVMGCYYLTASRGAEDEAVEAGDGMVFHSPLELFRAHAEHKLGMHAKVRVRMPIEKKVISEVKDEKGNPRAEELPRKPNGLVRTTVGRVIFNDILHPKMAFYDLPLSSKHLSRIIADCYQVLGRRETISLLDRMKETGFRQATRSGLSFAASDLRTPDNKEGVLKDKDKEVEKVRKNFDRGIITETERYNKVIDLWMEARDLITKKMMTDLRDDRRKDQVTGKEVPYLNPIYLMAHSGARGGIEQIRQLAGMRGLMAKPSGAIIETPIKSNFREGLTVLEYFSSTHGARKGLADTALKTADSGYLTRKLADVAQNVVITMHDCGTTKGISKGVMYKGDEIDRSLSDAIRGRVSRNSIPNPTTGSEILAENEMITPGKAKELEKLGIDKITVRSPMTCEAPLGVCRLCYGMDLATGSIVEDGMAVGIIAAQSIGEPGTQLTMRTFHIGGAAQSRGNVGDNEHKTKKGGIVQFERITVVTNDEGKNIALAPRTGEVVIIRGKDIAERYGVPHGAELLVTEGQEVPATTALVRWDPHSVPLIAEDSGIVRFKDIKEGVTVRREIDRATGVERLTIMEHKGDLHPQIIVETGKGKDDRVYYIHERANLQVVNGQKVSAGSMLAKTPREVSQTQDITGGLPRVTELFEARRPRNPAVMAEVAGRVRIDPTRKRGKRIIEVIQETEDGKSLGSAREHLVPASAHVRVHPSEYVKEGDPLVHGPLVPHDILKIRGEQEVQEYLVREVQSVYRSQRVDIDDKHIEIIVAQMLRKVKVTRTGDTGLLPGAVMDKFAFDEVNRRLTEECVKVVNAGDTTLVAGRVYSREAFEEERVLIEKDKKKQQPTFTTPEPADREVQLLGITKAAVQSDSFISAASFQETTKVLTEAALASKVDYLVGLKENVILGHLIPAGTGFKTHQEAEVKINAPGGGAPAPMLAPADVPPAPESTGA